MHLIIAYLIWKIALVTLFELFSPIDIIQMGRLWAASNELHMPSTMGNVCIASIRCPSGSFVGTPFRWNFRGKQSEKLIVGKFIAWIEFNGTFFWLFVNSCFEQTNKKNAQCWVFWLLYTAILTKKFLFSFLFWLNMINPSFIQYSQPLFDHNSHIIQWKKCIEMLFT